jgi:hypothetical protein
MARKMTLRFVTHNLVAEYEANGWRVTGKLHETHHGRHAVIMELCDPQSDEHRQPSEPAQDQ